MGALHMEISDLTEDDWVNPADTILDLLNVKKNQKRILSHYVDSAEPTLVTEAVVRAQKEASSDPMPPEVRWERCYCKSTFHMNFNFVYILYAAVSVRI